MPEDNRSKNPQNVSRDKDLEFDVFHVEGDISHLPGQRFTNHRRTNASSDQAKIKTRAIQDQLDGPSLAKIITDARITQQEAFARTREIKNNPVIKKSVRDSSGAASERVITDAGSPEHVRIISDGAGPQLNRSIEDGDGPITNRELPNHGTIIDLLEETLRSQRDALKQIRAMRDKPGPAFIRISTDAVGPPRIRQSTDNQGPAIQARRYAPGSGPMDHQHIASLPGPRLDKDLGTPDFSERIRIARVAQQHALSLLQSVQDISGPADTREMLDVNLSISRAREAQLRAMARLRHMYDDSAQTHENVISDAEGPVKPRAFTDLSEQTYARKLQDISADNPARATPVTGLNTERRSSDSHGPKIDNYMRDAEGAAIAREWSDATLSGKLRSASDAEGPSAYRGMSDAEGPVTGRHHSDADGPSNKRAITDGMGPKFIRAIKNLFRSDSKTPQTRTEIKLETHSVSIAERMAKIREEQLKTLEMLSDKKEK